MGMPLGSPRPAGGRMPDPTSESFQKKQAGLLALPANGYRRRPPKFPLAPYMVMRDGADGLPERDEAASQRWNDREAAVWRGLWRLPQGCAWSMPQYAYLQHSLALYVRQFVLCETSEARAADRTTLCRYADAVGLTPQGLRINGWRIVADEPDGKPEASNVGDGKVVPFPSARERFARMREGTDASGADGDAA